ncbi:Adenylate cyclase 1 [Symbiodinium microadriaticum]|uniref:Adenylate cyclase 1 n=1 Tax=Symbiodinium microadriaticum TaxID=2951 RepID=A0A1Q9E5T6_SYMMI|nr:Adenylate cyclase 1 [Symbiodinium microadriaticum]
MPTPFEAVHAESEEEAKNPPPSSRSWMKKAALVLTVGLGVVGFMSMPKARRFCQGLDLGAFQGKSNLGLDAEMALKADALKSIKKHSAAQKIVLKAMKSTGRKYSKHYEQREVRSLPADPADAARGMLTKTEIKIYKATRRQTRMRKAANAYCAFNVLEAFVSVVGMGDDINAIIRTCPPPRDGESELACQVNGAILVAWVANAAAKLSYAATNCALNLNVDAVCSVGVTGLVSVMGELAATASLAAATCTGVPPQVTTTKISVIGDQTVRDGRRLLAGQGPIGVGVQCGVDVSMVVANLANMGMSINSAVNSGQCGRVSLNGPINKVTGIFSALCTVDIGGAIAYMSQVVTFINLIVVHCQDFLDVSALCGASISGIITAAAALAPYGAAVHAACAEGDVLKNPKKQELINGLYTAFPRRLEEAKKVQEMKDAMANLKDLRQKLESKIGFNASVPTMYSEANMEQMIQLMNDGIAGDAETSMPPKVPIVSIVVPFWGYFRGFIAYNWLSQKRNYNGDYRYVPPLQLQASSAPLPAEEELRHSVGHGWMPPPDVYPTMEQVGSEMAGNEGVLPYQPRAGEDYFVAGSFDGGDCLWSVCSFLTLYLCGVLSVIGYDSLGIDLPALQSTSDMLGMLQSDSPSDSASHPPAPAAESAAPVEPVSLSTPWSPSPLLLESSRKIPRVGRKELKFINSQIGGNLIKEMVTTPPHKFGRDPAEPGAHFFEAFRHLSQERRRKYDWFFVVREPVDRFLAFYACCSRAANHTVREFNDWLQSQLRAATNKGGFSRLTDYMDPDFAVLQHVIHFENLATDLRHLLPLYNFSLDKLPMQPPEGRRFVRQDISEETMGFIRTYYMGDFVHFGYPDFHWKEEEADNRVCTTVTLALTVTLLWKDILNNMTHQIQDISALFAVTSISDFTRWPRLATDVNLEAISAFPDAMEVRLDQMIQLYMDGLSHRFHYVDYLAYGDRTGTFVGIERLPTHFKDKHPSSSVFGGEFRPSDLVGTSRQSCSMCPPPSALVQGEKAYYFVNDSTGAYRNRYDSKVVILCGSVTLVIVLRVLLVRAIMFEGEVLAVVSADFTVSFLSRFLREVTGTVPEQEGFVLDREGFLVASSLGVEAVVRWIWSDSISLEPAAALQRPAVTPRPEHGTMSSVDGRYLFTYTSSLPTLFQDKWRWIVIISRPTSAYLDQAVRLMKWDSLYPCPAVSSVLVSQKFRRVQTILYCSLFAFVGAVIMMSIGFAVSKPLHKISIEDQEENDMEEGQTGRLSQMLMHVAPREVHMRESFVYMVAGLKSFARYMDPEIMRIVVQSKRQAQLGMGKAPVTIFFSSSELGGADGDIANFTTIAESLDPETFMSMLSDYLDEMSKIIMGKRGVVGEFIGDAIMAWWNAAVYAQRMANTSKPTEYLSFERSGRMKDFRRFEFAWAWSGVLYGLVGDSVNLASRLEGKFYGVDIIIEEEAASAPGVGEKFHLRVLDLVTVKGRNQATELFQLVGATCRQKVCKDAAPYLAGLTAAYFGKRYFTDGFTQVHALYRARQFEDVPSKMLLQRVETLLQDPPPADWLLRITILEELFMISAFLWCSSCARYGGRMLTGKKGCYHPKLWCFLVAPVPLRLQSESFIREKLAAIVTARVCTTVTLALTVTLLWKDILNNMTHQIQDISALFAVTSISDFTRWPRLATDVNLEAISAFPDAMEVRLDQMIQLYMDGLSHRFHYVDYLAYGDRTGTFVGIERLPTHFKDKHPSSSVFGGEFRPSDLVGTSRPSCSMCPPPSALVQGEKAYYFVNDSTGAYRNRYDSKVVILCGSVTLVIVLRVLLVRAIMFEGEVLAVVSADFTVSFLSRFLREVTGTVPEQEGFVLDREGFMVASSLGVEAVVRPEHGTMSSVDGRYLFTYTSSLPTPFQVRRQEIADQLHQQELLGCGSAIQTILYCFLFAFAGAVIMMSIGLTANSTGSRKIRILSGRSRAGSSASENDSSSSEDQEENDMEEGQTGRLSQMLMHVAPREVHMRESFVYMVAGLKSFARYMDPEIMRIVVQSSKRQAQLGMGKAPVTIFFSSSELGGADGDIANFTTIAESLDPETFMRSDYLDEMSKIIMGKRGVVGEFIGDAIMAWWNAAVYAQRMANTSKPSAIT